MKSWFPRLLIPVLTLLLLASAPLYAFAPVPVVYYDFEEDTLSVDGDPVVNKGFGGVLDGIVLGTNIVWTTGAPAGYSPGNGLAMDGSNWYAGGTRIDTQQSVIDLGVLGPSYTMAAWVNLTKTSGDAFVFGQTNLTSNILHLGVRDSHPHLGHWASDLASGITMQAGVWYHIVWQFEQEAQRIYVNGQLDSVAFPRVQIREDGTLVIGTARGNNTWSFSGVLDDILVYQEVLTAEQIAFLAAGGDPNTLPESVTSRRFFTGPYGPGDTWNLYEVVGGPAGAAASWYNAYLASTNLDPVASSGLNGHLVSVQSVGENDFLRQLQREGSGDVYIGDVWIGLTDNDLNSVSLVFPGASESGKPVDVPDVNQRRTNGWVWSSGELHDETTYSNWAPNEPNDTAPSEDAVAIRSDGQWNDYPSGIPGSGDNTNLYVYIVEWDVASAQSLAELYPEVGELDSILPDTLPGPDPDEGLFSVYRVDETGPVGSLRQAVEVLVAGTGTVQMTSSGPSVINAYDPDFPALAHNHLIPYNDVMFGDIGGVQQMNYAMVYKGQIEVRADQAGPWTFGVHSDDGFALRLPGLNWTEVYGIGLIDPADRSTLAYELTGGDSDTRGLITLPAGIHNIEFVTYQSEGGVSHELYAAPGAMPADASTGDWRLVNYKGQGEVPLPTVSDPGDGKGWIVWHTDSGLGAQTGSNTAWTAVQPYVLADSNRTTWAEINFIDPDNGAENLIPNSVPFPFDTPIDDNHRALYAQATLLIPDAGTYVLGFRGDDGSSLQVVGEVWNEIVIGMAEGSYIDGDTIVRDGAMDDSFTMGSITLGAGSHDLRLLYWEIAGGADVDVMCGSAALVGQPVPASGAASLITAASASMMDPDGLGLAAGVVLAINGVAVNMDADTLVLTWESEADATYRIESAGTLNPSSWDVEASAIATQGAVTEHAIPNLFEQALVVLRVVKESP